GDSKFHCWHDRGHGQVDLHTAVRESCDIWFYQAALKLGVDRLGEYCKMMGLGKAHALPLQGVRAGLVPDRAWKIRRHGVPWVAGDTVVAGIGQGYFQTTPLQLAVATARIASGKMVKPRLVMNDYDTSAMRSLPVAQKNLAIIRDAMYQVVNTQRGTAFNISGGAMQIAGKTGSVQVRRISEHEREFGLIEQEDLPRHQRDHAMFISYAPFDNPRWAAACVVEHGISGSKAAAPIVNDVLQYLYKESSRSEV
ncbi:MAG: penicillin-binding transpeptidase domain-containing protein, partial [Pseudomonadota bacterium]